MMNRPFPRWLAITLLLVLFVSALLFYSRHNHFPIYYHPDEELKGVQIVTGELNYHHPLLLLDTGGLILRMGGFPRTIENAVYCGRLASALFTSLSLVALTILASRRGGWAGAVLAAGLIGLHPLLYELSHFCKEDPALLLGISLTLLALDVYSTRPTLLRAACLGAACGVAISGKYLGIVLLFVALPWIIWKGALGRRRIQAVGVFLLGVLATVLLINFPFLLNLKGLIGAFGYELNAAQVGGAKGLTRDVPHAKYLGVFVDNIGWPLWIGLVFFVAGWWVRKSERRASDWVNLLMPLGYILLLSFSPKTANRYFLAASPLLILCGSLGIVWLGQFLARLHPRIGYGALALLALTALHSQWILTIPNIRSFRSDSRMAMAAWIATNLPSGASVLAENRVGLKKPETWSRSGSRADLKISEKIFAPDFGSYEKLQGDGVRYIAVIRTSYGGYLSDQRKPSTNLENQHQRRSAFYQQLFQNATLLKKTGGSGVAHLNPEIRLYEIPTQGLNPVPTR